MAGSNAGFDATMGPASTAASGGASEWNAGTVSAVGSNLSITSGTLNGATPQWQGGVVDIVGAGLSVVGVTLKADWEGGAVGTLGSGISLNSGTLSATGAAQEWTAGTVSAIGSGLSLSGGTISATGGSGGNSQIVTSAPFTRPSSTHFTWRNQAGATLTDVANGPLIITSPSSDPSPSIHGLEMNVPGSTPWTLTGQSSVASGPGGNPAGGIYISDGTKIVTLWQVINQVFRGEYTTATSFSAQNGLSTPTFIPWLRITNTGTLLNYYVSSDGVAWALVLSDTVGSFLGAITVAGFCGAGQSSTQTTSSLRNWELVTGAGSNATFQATY